MPFVKIVKNKAYFKRYQVKYRRRREGKTDYRARRQMVLQDKTKYGAPKYRFVVRITNRDVIAQIVHAKVKGDDVICAAHSHELPAFGINFGLTNYASAYATGLLCARRLLAKLKIDKLFAGVPVATGEHKDVLVKGDDTEERFPFKAILDVGLARTTTGARIFGCMKGAVDGGLAIPHSPNRFPGYNKTKSELNANVHRDRILGKHVGDYMKKVKEMAASDEGNQMFKKMIAANIDPSKIQSMYKSAHEAIRRDPTKTIPKKSKEEMLKKVQKKARKLTGAQKVTNARAKVQSLRAALNK